MTAHARKTGSTRALAHGLKNAACCIWIALVLPAHSQNPDWPNRPVVLINPFSAGSSVDVVGRLIAQKIATNTGQGVTVDNKTGASGNIGTDYAARAKPDGYTLLLGSPGTMAINPWLFAKLPYDVQKDFLPVSQLVSFPQVVVTSPKQNIKSIPDLLKAAKAQPDKFAHASSGPGTTSHLVMELIKADAGITMIHVGYRGGAPAMQALMAGEVLAPQTLTAMRVPQSATRALGWEIRHPEWAGGLACSAGSIGHTGFTGTGLWIDWDRGLAWSLLTNRVHPSRHVDTGIQMLRRRVGERMIAAFDSAI